MARCGAALAMGLSAAPLFAQSSAPQATNAAERKTGQPGKGAAPDQTAEALKPEDAPELDLLTFHRSTYFISGFTERTQAKFQFSFKYDFWPSTSHHTVYFAYTQKSLWDIFDRSSPFRESNYAPEVFYAHYHSELHGQPQPGCGLFSEQLGFEHESNGEASDASRSWNRLFANVEATCYGPSLYGVLGLRLWYPLGTDENETITETQGYGELSFGLGIDHDRSHMNGLVTVAVRKGASRELGKGSLTLDARWRPTYQRLLGKAWKFAPYVWFQWFVGYGETLATYDGSNSSVRLGLGITDRSR